MTAPPIPAPCAHRPTTGDGLIIPWANVHLADGGCDFRAHHNARWAACWRDRRCQVCGDRLDRLVLLCGPRQLAHLMFDEPPLHPECARYVTQACPMVAGRREHYRTGDPLANRPRGRGCPVPGCDCGGWVPTPGIRPDSGGDPAHPWYAVYATSYHPAITPGGELVGGVCLPSQIRRVRLVSAPGTAHRPWIDVPDWADRYAPPAFAPEASR